MKVDDGIPDSSLPLGHPLPNDEHACSVSLPTWSCVVGYEEGKEEVTSKMKCGYPRFVYHPYILQLMQYAIDNFVPEDGSSEDCIVVPSAAAALRCRIFLQQALEGISEERDNALLDHMDAHLSLDETSAAAANPRTRIRTVSLQAADVHAVMFPAETRYALEAKAYWQHTGELVSSRRAERALQDLGVEVAERVTEGGHVRHSHNHTTTTATLNTATNTASEELQLRIAEWTKVPKDHVFLSPSGMCGLYEALRSSRRYQLEQHHSLKGGKAIVFGFPYLDTLKLCSRRELCPGGVDFYGRGNQHDLNNLQRQLEHSHQQDWCALLTEVPSNPLLQCPDLWKLRQLANDYKFALVVDDTIGNFLNLDLLESGLADAVCTSLTKLVSGRGDVMGGSVVVNPHTPMGRWMQQDLQENSMGGLDQADAHALVVNSHDFCERNRRINETSERMADFLLECPDVDQVYYPKYNGDGFFPQLLKRGGGFGGLASILLGNHICQRTFYDALDVAKGPSLGTNFTLVCPYTLLAHYHELDFAMTYNVAPNLLRIAFGMEDPVELQAKFEAALDQSRLHPKVVMPQERSPFGGSGTLSRSFCTLAKAEPTARTWLRRGVQQVLRRNRFFVR